MFNIGGGELLVIMLLALLVLGPQRLPDAARQAGKAMGELRRISSGFQNELKQAMDQPAAAVKRAVTPTDDNDSGKAASTEPTTSPKTRPRRAKPLEAPRRNGS